MYDKTVSGIESINGHSNGEAEFSCSPLQRSFRQELEAAVEKHSRYLQEVKNMPKAKLPTWYFIVKRSMDILVGTLGLILLSPLLLVVIVMIKLDSRGPIFFSQIRVGKNGKLFKIHKFRTMVADAEEKTGPVWATENDPRLTYVGRFLRKSKIDEFPQFVNLIMGNMTMVGPRPERPSFVDHFIRAVPGYERRLDVSPGITGAAQLRNGYDSCAADIIRKLRFDITYVKKMGLYTDIGILAETFLAVVKGRL